MDHRDELVTEYTGSCFRETFESLQCEWTTGSRARIPWPRSLPSGSGYQRDREGRLLARCIVYRYPLPVFSLLSVGLCISSKEEVDLSPLSAT